MSIDGLWVTDPDTGQELFMTFEELESDVRQELIKPIGGFVFRANDLIACDNLAKTPFYIQDWLPQRGKMLMYSSAKAGKSYLATQMGRCLASGEDFLEMPTTQARTLYIQFELGEDTLRNRLVSTGQDYTDLYCGSKLSMKLDTEHGQKLLNRAMEAVKPRVLIIDPLYKALIGDENEAQDMKKPLDYLDTLIEAYECSVVIIHHAGKDMSRRGRGSSVLEDWVDSYIQIKVDSKKGETLRIAIQPQFLRHAALPEQPVKCELSKNFEFEIISGDTGSVKDKVYGIIAKSAVPVSPAILFEAGIGSNTSVYRALTNLVGEGKVIKVGHGEYALKK